MRLLFEVTVEVVSGCGARRLGCNAMQRNAEREVGESAKSMQLYFGMVCSGLNVEEKGFHGHFDEEKESTPDLELKLTCWCCLS
jgi:hypothetical protein